MSKAPFRALLLLLLALVWLAPHFPAQDAPAHLYTSKVLATLLTQPDSPLHHVFELNPTLTTNWTAHLVLTPLLFLTDPLTADRLALSLLFLLLYAALRRLPPHLLPLSLPLYVNSMTLAGFYSFLYGVAFALLAITTYLDSETLTTRRKTALFALLLLAWLSHPLTWAAATFALLALALPDLRKLALILALAAPGLAAALHFALHFSTQSIAPPPLFQLNLARLLVGENPVVSLHLAFAAAGLAILLLTAFHIHAALKSNAPHNARLLHIALAFTLLYLLAPMRSMTGNFVPRRFALFAFAFTLLWLATQTPAPHWRRASALAAHLAAAAFLAVLAWRTAALAPAYREYETLSLTQPTLALRFSMNLADADGNDLSVGLDPFLHAHDWLLLKSGALDLNNYEAATPHFPLRYKPSFRRGFSVDTNEEPPCVQFDPAHLPPSILLWGYPENPTQPCAKALLQTLRQHYSLAQRSSPRALGQIHLLRSHTIKE